MKKPSIVSLAVGAAFAAIALTPVAHAAGNPFTATQLQSGYQLAEADMKSTAKMPDAKCGADKKAAEKKAEAKCGADKKAAEKKAEAKCGADKKATDKKADAACGSKK